MVLDGLALSVESIVLWAQVGLQSPLGVAAEGREGGAGDTGGEHGGGVGGVVDRLFADAPSLDLSMRGCEASREQPEQHGQSA